MLDYVQLIDTYLPSIFPLRYNIISQKHSLFSRLPILCQLNQAPVLESFYRVSNPMVLLLPLHYFVPVEMLGSV